jgi:hypothetical protein
VERRRLAELTVLLRKLEIQRLAGDRRGARRDGHEGHGQAGTHRTGRNGGISVVLDTRRRSGTDETLRIEFLT